ncbi:hypothetical protein QCA50_003679 [Cerrena zonata]|uniref:Cytochrome c oxidase assembly protein COX16, mitochondrial n=1 Tax=Cerrena zonata TaxID=2478898 RepID=A0AAW0GL73_9APHY
MPTFQSNPINTSTVHRKLRKHPAWFGIPFLAIMIGASYGLQTFTQTRFDLADQKVKQVNKEEELGLKKSKRKFDIREEYYRLNTAVEEEWENKRIPRPAGLPEWGVPPTEPQPSSSNSKA